MTAKQIVQNFYKSDVLLDTKLMESFLHPEVILDWNSSKGFLQMNRTEILALSAELSVAYVRSKIKISHILQDENQVSVRYSHYVKTFENPREEMLLAHFMVIWEIKEDKLFRGFQMSQLS
ncbi:nuclear transport factor 2 family protein [Flavobacterium macacae]|uniref:Nuclear transport factor 2 family protein n=1 Tax=Flavobacterium macacae TaxID=2488993 RepID=A0A3P3WFD0_9FLAO|nr:nuclear transport factor 2 family protein [Flavobacterium macacae]RRJ93374.1 nuclear transport factor 2 family protein [Flavobacterium macacae]